MFVPYFSMLKTFYDCFFSSSIWLLLLIFYCFLLHKKKKSIKIRAGKNCYITQYTKRVRVVLCLYTLCYYSGPVWCVVSDIHPNVEQNRVLYTTLRQCSYVCVCVYCVAYSNINIVRYLVNLTITGGVPNTSTNTNLLKWRINRRIQNIPLSLSLWCFSASNYLFVCFAQSCFLMAISINSFLVECVSSVSLFRLY